MWGFWTSSRVGMNDNQFCNNLPLFHWCKHLWSPYHPTLPIHDPYFSLPISHQWKRVTLFFGDAPPKHMALNSNYSFFYAFLSFLYLWWSLELFCVTLILFLFSLYRTHMSFGILVIIATNIPKSYSLISHFQESNIRVYPWSRILLTLSKLCFRSSTNRKF